MEIYGSGFTPDDQAVMTTYGYNLLPTTYVNSSELRAWVDSKVLSDPYNAPVFVGNAYERSNEVPFAITRSTASWPVNSFIFDQSSAKVDELDIDAGNYHATYFNVTQLQTTITLPALCTRTTFTVHATLADGSKSVIQCGQFASSANVEVDMEVNNYTRSDQIFCAVQVLSLNHTCQTH